MSQEVEWENSRRASEVMTSSSVRKTSVGDTISAFGQQRQPPEVYHPSIHRHNNRWSAGRPHTSSLFGAGCFFLGEASASLLSAGARPLTWVIVPDRITISGLIWMPYFQRRETSALMHPCCMAIGNRYEHLNNAELPNNYSLFSFFLVFLSHYHNVSWSVMFLDIFFSFVFMCVFLSSLCHTRLTVWCILLFSFCFDVGEGKRCWLTPNRN